MHEYDGRAVFRSCGGYRDMAEKSGCSHLDRLMIVSQ